jgi:hypothetical protein
MLANNAPLPIRISRPRKLYFSTAMSASNDHRERSSSQLGAAARAAIELRADRNVCETEWVAMRGRLLEFSGILREWDRKTTASRRGNLEVLCQPEP